MNTKDLKSQDYDGYHKYDKNVAKNYEKHRQDEKHWKEEDKFIENYILLRKNQISSLLDLPIGTGRFIHHYVNINSVVGIDISDSMLDEAREKLHCLPPDTSINLLQGSVFDLDFPDKQFDSTIIFRLFHLMPQASVKMAIKEICRVTRKEIVVQTYVPMNYFSILYRKAITKLKMIINYRNVSSIKETQDTTKPWSHIQAYYHRQEFFNDEFRKFNFFPITSNLLDKYENCEVRVTIFSKKN